MVQLVQVTQIAFQAEQAKLQGILDRENAIEESLASLRQSVHERTAVQQHTADAALLAGADFLWRTWVDKKRAALNVELASLRAERATHHAALAQAFGRKQVAEKLLKNMKRKK
jgi:hypothetical protein